MLEPESTSTQSQSTEGKFRNWQAIANFQPIVSKTPLRVGGEYHLNRRSGSVRLEAAVPQGFNPRILLLNLIIEGSGLGGDWVKVEERFPATEGQYDSVTVTDENGEHVSVDVEDVH